MEALVRVEAYFRADKAWQVALPTLPRKLAILCVLICACMHVRPPQMLGSLLRSELRSLVVRRELTWCCANCTFDLTHTEMQLTRVEAGRAALLQLGRARAGIDELARAVDTAARFAVGAAEHRQLSIPIGCAGASLGLAATQTVVYVFLSSSYFRLVGNQAEGVALRQLRVREVLTTPLAVLSRARACADVGIPASEVDWVVRHCHSLPPSHPPSLTHSLPHPLTHSLPHPLPHPLTHSLTHSLSLARSFTHSVVHPLNAHIHSHSPILSSD